MTQAVGGRAVPRQPPRLLPEPPPEQHTIPVRKQAVSQELCGFKTRTAVVRKLSQGDPEGATPLVPLLDLAPRQVYRGGANAQMAYSPFPAVVSSWQRANLFRQARSQDCTARPLEEDLTHHEV